MVRISRSRLTMYHRVLIKIYFWEFLKIFSKMSPETKLKLAHWSVVPSTSQVTTQHSTRCLTRGIALRVWYLLRQNLTVMDYSIGISVIENLGTLLESSDVSKRRQARVNLISWKFLGNVAPHQVVGSRWNFHQSDQEVHRKTAPVSDFRSDVWVER